MARITRRYRRKSPKVIALLEHDAAIQLERQTKFRAAISVRKSVAVKRPVRNTTLATRRLMLRRTDYIRTTITSQRQEQI